MTRDTALRAGSRREYSMQEHGHSEVGVRQGKHVCKPTVDYWNLAYGDGKTTTIRILPGINPDYNQADPNSSYWDAYRLQPYSTQNERAWGDWIRRYSAIRGAGDPATTFIIADPTQMTQAEVQSTPAWILYNAIDRAVANKQEGQGWAAMLRGGSGRRAMLPKPSEIYLVQAFIAGHGAKTYWPPRGYGPDEKTAVMELSTSAGEAMIAEINRVTEGYQGEPYDWERSMANGDPISLDYGRWITFYTLADGDPRQRQQTQAAGWNAPAQRGAGGRAGQNEPIGYGCFLESSFQNVPARLREQEQVVYSKVKPWRDILNLPTIEEQAAMLADKFPADVIGYAWRDHDEWIPESVKKRLANSRSFGGVAMDGVHGYGQPGALLPPPGAMPPQPGWGQLPPPPPTGMGGPPGMAAPPQQGWAAPPPMQTQMAPPSQMAPPPQQQFPPQQGFAPPQQGFAPPQPGVTAMPGQPGMPPLAAAFGPPQLQQGFPPQAAPGFPPQQQPGFQPPQAAPGFPAQAAPPGFGPQAPPVQQPSQQPPQATPGFGPPQAAPGYGPPQAAPGFGPPQAAPGYGPPQGGPQQQPPFQSQFPPQQQSPQQPAMAWGASGNSVVDAAVPTGMPPGAPVQMPPQMQQPQFAPPQQAQQPPQQAQQPPQQYAPQQPAGQFPGQPPTGYAQQPPQQQPPAGGQATRASAALAAAQAAAAGYQQPPQQ